MNVKIELLRLSINMYILYAFLPFLHSLPTIIKVFYIGVVYLLWLVSAVNRKGGYKALILFCLTVILSVLMYVGMYTNTIFNRQFGIDKLLMLVLFWLPLLYMPLINVTYCREKGGKIFGFLVCVVCFTALTTLLGIIMFEEPCRELAKAGTELSKYYQRLNIGGYGFIYSLCFIIPVLEYLYSKTKEVKWLLIIILFAVCIIGSSFGTAFILATIIQIGYFSLVVVKSKSLKALLIGVEALLVFLYEYFADLFLHMSVLLEKIGVESLSVRMEHLYRSILLGQQVGDVRERGMLRQQSIDAFMDSPIIGNVTKGKMNLLGMHSDICDILGGTGIVGFLLLGVLVLICIRYFQKLNANEKQINLIGLTIFIGLLFLAYVNTCISSIEILLIICSMVFIKGFPNKRNGIH